MHKTLTIDGINILIKVTETGEELGKFYFCSRKYDIWCLDNTWEEAQEDLAWILRDKVKAYSEVPYSQMPTKVEKAKWKLYQDLLDHGFKVE